MITVNGMKVEIVRKSIKNLHLAVYPPAGRVRVAVPLNITDENVRMAVINKLGWIKRQQARFIAQPRQSKREYVNGESHYVKGKRYRLNVIEGSGRQWVAINSRTIITMYIQKNKDAISRHRVMEQWYRQQLKETIPSLVQRWQDKIGVSVNEWQVKRMRTRWGSCNPSVRRIWLNLELAKKPIDCLEYVVVHEMVHLLEPSHNANFVSLMDRYLPKWRFYRDELNKLPVRHENWKY
ncbi:MAG: SprT family zinc-dependent metalloprotease [Kiritimatiellae bacterium]|jgi:predicted metal-dependent hydrolase|nr:SprT family zinc-dependent metalloprotease [Kiritimatiellia bacterium]